ncbi:MAG: type II secretion system protein C, partial [Sphingomonas bacterium]|nr:type II secretion system protein C [Sphingomonas bacterium]
MNRTLIIQRLSAARLPSDAGVWLKAILLAALAAKSAQLLWAIVTPVGPLGEWRAPAPLVLSREAQVALFATVNPFDRAGPGAAVAAAALPSDLKLFGVRDNIGSDGGGAIIALADGTQLSISVGESVMPGVVLVGVGFDYADIERGGARQRLFLDQDKPPETLGPGGAAGAPPAAAGLTPQA